MTGAVLLALAPVALLVALGHLIRRTGFVADAFWPQAERLCYYILLPALFMHSLATAHVQSPPVAALACALIGSTAMVALMVVAARPLLKVDGAAFTSVFQGRSASTTMSACRWRPACSARKASRWRPCATRRSCRRST